MRQDFAESEHLQHLLAFLQFLYLLCLNQYEGILLYLLMTPFTAYAETL